MKLSEEEADKLAKQMSGGVGLSSWNQAGTWEERGHTDWAKARVEELVVGKTVDVRGAARPSSRRSRRSRGTPRW